LQWRLNHKQPDERFQVVADVIRHHRQQHAWKRLVHLRSCVRICPRSYSVL
jgi:hypothetical protein